MQYIDILLAHYGWEGLALMSLLLIMLYVQLRYYIFVYGRIPSYKNNRRPSIRKTEPPISVIVPLFVEDTIFVEERLPLLLSQEYSDFEIVLVYIGSNSDFYEDLLRLKETFPHITATKIHLDPRYPISRKMALNVGIKSAHNEHLVFASTTVSPRSDRWLSLMAKGFCKGDIVLGYCGIERKPGFTNYFMRTWRMMHSALWIGSAVRQQPYRGTLQNLGFTKNIYFGANGFSHLNMNIGEDDLFMQKVMTQDNTSVILSPKASMCETTWGGMQWWLSEERYYGSTTEFYQPQIKTYIIHEPGSRVLFFALAATTILILPFELKIAAAALVLLRYLIVAIMVKRVAKRLGERGIMGRYFIYDIISPFYDILLAISMIRKDERVWR